MARNKVFWAVKLIITLVILFILLNKVKPGEILEALRNAKLGFALGAALLLPVNIGLQYLRWRLLLVTLKPQTGFSEIMGSLLVGITLGLATPGRLGELGRAFAINDVDRLQVLGLSLADKFYAISCAALFGGLAILSLPGMVFDLNPYIIVSLGIFYAVGAFIILYLATHPGFVRGALYSVSLMLPKRDKMKALVTCLDGINPRRARTVLLVSVLFFFTYILQFYLLTRAFGDLGLLEGMRGLPAVIFTKTFLPISIGGLGVGETMAVYILDFFGVDSAAAFNASLTLFALNILLPGIVGFFFIPKLNFRRK